MGANFSDITPAAPSGHTNVAFQSDTAGNISANIPTPVDAATQAANKVLAGPTTGSAATPAFRLLVAADIPNIAESQVTSLTTDLAAKVPTSRTISTTAPLTGGGDLSANRTLAISNFVGDSGSGGSAGAVPAPASGDAAAGKFLKADGTFAVPAGTSSGTVTSVALTVPSWLSVAGSPVTTAGTLAVTAATGQTANLFLATPNGSTGAATLRAIVQADLPAQPYDIPCSLVGKPGAAAIVLILTATRAISFSANFSGAFGTVGTNPTATAAYVVLKNGSSIGGVSISTGGVFTFTTTSGATQSLAAGDRLTITAPTLQDATLSDVGFTIPGTR